MFVSLALISLCLPRHADVVDALKMRSNFTKWVYAYKIVRYSRSIYKYDLDALKIPSNFKKCIYAYKIVCYNRPIYKYDLDAIPMLLMRSLIDGRLNFKKL